MGPSEFRDWRRLGGPSKISVIEILKSTGTVMKKAAKCGLGQAAPEPLLSSIKLFEQEYHTLIAQRQEEYEHFVENSSASSNRAGVSDPVRSIMRRIDL
jgi:hypothetical protein